MLDKAQKKLVEDKIRAEKEARAAALKKINDDIEAEKEKNKKIALSEIPFLEKSIKQFDERMKVRGANVEDLKQKKEKFQQKLARFNSYKK